MRIGIFSIPNGLGPCTSGGTKKKSTLLNVSAFSRMRCLSVVVSLFVWFGCQFDSIPEGIRLYNVTFQKSFFLSHLVASMLLPNFPPRCTFPFVL